MDKMDAIIITSSFKRIGRMADDIQTRYGFQFKSIMMTIKIRKKLKIVCKINYNKSPILINIKKILFK